MKMQARFPDQDWTDEANRGFAMTKRVMTRVAMTKRVMSGKRTTATLLLSGDFKTVVCKNIVATQSPHNYPDLSK